VVPSEEGPHRRYYAINDAYPKAQRQFDPDSGQSTPVPAPEFRPPPGPLRSP
jgi:hypothetical protein